MSTDPSGGGGRAGHRHDRDDADKDVSETADVGREGDYVDRDVDPAVPTAEREGEYTDSDSDLGSADTDPPTGSYVTKDVQP